MLSLSIERNKQFKQLEIMKASQLRKIAKGLKFPFIQGKTMVIDSGVYYREENSLNVGFKKVFKVEKVVKSLGWNLVSNETEGRNNFKTFVSPDNTLELSASTLFEGNPQMTLSLTLN